MVCSRPFTPAAQPIHIPAAIPRPPAPPTEERSFTEAPILFSAGFPQLPKVLPSIPSLIRPRSQTPTRPPSSSTFSISSISPFLPSASPLIARLLRLPATLPVSFPAVREPRGSLIQTPSFPIILPFPEPQLTKSPHLISRRHRLSSDM